MPLQIRGGERNLPQLQVLCFCTILQSDADFQKRGAEKVKELQQSVQKSEKQKQQLQKTVAEFESKAKLAEKREQLMSARLQSSSGEVGQLKLDFDMLKGEVIHAHQELQTVAEENAKVSPTTCLHPPACTTSSLNADEHHQLIPLRRSCKIVTPS